jgi:hypothetical protein
MGHSTRGNYLLNGPANLVAQDKAVPLLYPPLQVVHVFFVLHTPNKVNRLHKFLYLNGYKKHFLSWRKQF